jgi:hypothetical protein
VCGLETATVRLRRSELGCCTEEEEEEGEEEEEED